MGRLPQITAGCYQVTYAFPNSWSALPSIPIPLRFPHRRCQTGIDFLQARYVLRRIEGSWLTLSSATLGSMPQSSGKFKHEGRKMKQLSPVCRALLAGALLLSCLNRPALAEAISTKTYSYFTIGGKTAEDLDRELSQRGPVTKVHGLPAIRVRQKSSSVANSPMWRRMDDAAWAL